MKPLLEHQAKIKFGEKMRLAWYFETWFEKLIVVLGTLSLFYTIIRMIVQGVW
ncbi:MAG: hypothetical protein ACE5ES_03545 [Candidatus Nanoarchaeia archaeon]